MPHASIFGGGNLVQNPGFETGDLSGWSALSVVVANTTDAHTGDFIARFVLTDTPGILVQDIQIPAGQVFALIFHLSGLLSPPDDFRAEVRWMNQNRLDLGQGLLAFINGQAVGEATDGEWTAQYFLTGPAPNDARFARLIFAAGPEVAGNSIQMDDVVFQVV